MSKQYLALHTIENVHDVDIFAIAATKNHILSASGSSSIQISSTKEADFPTVQVIHSAHNLGCHHLVTSKNGRRAASAGFEGKVRLWQYNAEHDGQWESIGEVTESGKAGEAWALALSEDGSFLACTSYNGRINVWSVVEKDTPKIREYETKGSFGMSIDLSIDGKYTASGHENGSIYVFNNDTGRMMHSLSGQAKPVRTVKFSPASKLLAAAGDSRTIALYDVTSGEQVGNLSGHRSWIFSIDWSDTGEFLLSGAYDGKAKVWSIPTRACVATHTENDKALWSVTWLPRTVRSEMFAVAGAGKSIKIYREASGG